MSKPEISDDSDMTELIERIKMSEIYNRVGPETAGKTDKVVKQRKKG